MNNESSSSSVGDQLSRLKDSFLLAACCGGRIHEAESLVCELGADINWVNHDSRSISSDTGDGGNDLRCFMVLGDTPLLACVRNGHIEIATLLLAYGADSDIPNCITGDNVLHLCAKEGNVSMAQLFDRRKMRVLALQTNHTGQTPAQVAVAANKEDFLSLLEEESSSFKANKSISGNNKQQRDREKKFSKVKVPVLRQSSDKNSTSESQTFCDEQKVHELQKKISNLVTLRKIMVTEVEDERRRAEGLAIKVKVLHRKCSDLEASKGQLLSKVDSFEGRGIDSKSIEELEDLELQLRETLQIVSETKANVISSRLREVETNTTCVICQEVAKSVLFLPCKHLCACEDCARGLITCPLCRTKVSEQMKIFS